MSLRDQASRPGQPAPQAAILPTRGLAWCVVAAAVLLALRKPWALHTPQFWAEDGSIFMTQAEQFGLRAFLEPYNGYLHFLPRFIAWLSPNLADVAWWPAIYNGFAYAVNVALFARLASPRVQLPAKPGLMLVFVLVVGTGEPLINVTNLQWVAAFFLVLQLFLAPPTNGLQRAGDLAILAAVGLNGPFAIVLAPLFVWRAWREPRRDTFLALGVIGGCALLQGMLLWRAGPALYSSSEAFRPMMALSILGSRLVTWVFFGPAAVRAAPLWVHAVFGGAAIVALLAWAGRDHPRRGIRAVLVAAFCLMTLACSYRVRADTWQDDNLVNGDRYFYISRVLLVWLLVLEWNATPRAIAWTARALCLSGVLFHLPHFVLPAPPDYRWTSHCDPIRRGEPANIHTLPEGWWIEYPGRPKKP
ncbi:MAG: hypothetical protein HZC55_04860 [Verrucomicrobia bacterium]|nr:hypothetical protein [Verrucomicrobiota bacterium]